ncbi:hypothetical protein A0H81_14000 [Grifola frondosa]|uniref:Uncharacterized protein n=1 Tax=Grifola frondosa TaxID=5627 RepID=A0A1C7LQ23_GRIFR|nr:hypothetical protein A0H81_14000 [Grifola frondosa]
MATEAKLAKEKVQCQSTKRSRLTSNARSQGDAAFKDGDYSSAHERFTNDMRLHSSDYVYPFDRAMAEALLKFRSTGLANCLQQDGKKPRAIQPRRSPSIPEKQNHTTEGVSRAQSKGTLQCGTPPFADIEAYAASRGDPAVAAEQNSHIMVTELSSLCRSLDRYRRNIAGHWVHLVQDCWQGHGCVRQSGLPPR